MDIDTPTSDTATKRVQHTVRIDDNPAVPPVRGRTVDQATAAIDGDFQPGMVTQVESALPPGQVVGTSPGEGTRLAPGSTVSILVSKGPRVLSVTEARAGQDAMNVVFSPDGIMIVEQDTTAPIAIPGASGQAFLQSRTSVGRPGAPAAGLRAYEYRVATGNLTGGGACTTSLSVPFAGTPVAQDYARNGSKHDVFVITQGGLGDVRVAKAELAEGVLTFVFAQPVCRGQESFFFGLAAAGAPRHVTASLGLSAGPPLALDARSPAP
jgi:hypothetical protein